MESVEFSTNKIWQNWQVSHDNKEIEGFFHRGWQTHPPEFSEQALDENQFLAVRQWADSLQDKGVETLLVAGIGGSALGAKAVRGLQNRYSPKLFFWEGTHPQELHYIGKLAEQKKTALLWVSKSGTTLETRTNLALFRQFFPEVEEYFVTSYPESVVEMGGKKENTFIIPQTLPARFSVMSYPGIMPGLFLGADMDSFLNGFRDGVLEWDISAPLASNNAKQIALQYYQLFLSNFQGVVFWIYSREMRGMAEWLVHLWAESLGKQASNTLLPVLCRGPEDQHSLLQYMLDGPNNMVHTFLHTRTYGINDTVVPNSYSVYSGNKSLWEVLHAQKLSTEIALTEKNRPVSDFEVPELNHYQLGRMMCFWMHTVTYLGYLYEIDPFSQPAAEVVKMHSRRVLSLGDKVENPLAHRVTL